MRHTFASSLTQFINIHSQQRKPICSSTPSTLAHLGRMLCEQCASPFYLFLALAHSISFVHSGEKRNIRDTYLKRTVQLIRGYKHMYMLKHNAHPKISGTITSQGQTLKPGPAVPHLISHDSALDNRIQIALATRIFH